jgi:hypothetical protein
MPKTLYLLKDFHGGGKTTSLVCFKETIVIPGQLQKHVINWYHTTLSSRYKPNRRDNWTTPLVAKNASTHITNYVQICPLCQRNKRRQKKYGLLPPKLAEATPWDKLCADLIGPSKIRRKGNKDLICRCVTMIDPATGWFEIQLYDDKQSITVANKIEQEWFLRYPWPKK